MNTSKGIPSFLLITFGITYLAEGILILYGFRVMDVPAIIGQYVILGAMWIPAVAALLTIPRKSMVVLENAEYLAYAKYSRALMLSWPRLPVKKPERKNTMASDC